MMVTLSPDACGVIVHHQADMLEEGAEAFIFLHRAGELGEVLEPAGGLGAALGLEHGGVAAFVEQDAGELGVRQLARHLPPAGDVGDETRPRLLRARDCSSSLSSIEAAASSSGCWRRARVRVDRSERLVAEAALGLVDDPLEGEVVGRLGDQAEIGEGVADLGPLVEAEAADDLIGEADGDEALLELAGLELGADEDGARRRASRRGAGAPRFPRRRGAPPPARPRRR